MKSCIALTIYLFCSSDRDESPYSSTFKVGLQMPDSHRRHMSERFFRSKRPGYPHPVCSELENSGIRVAVGDYSVTERWRWRRPYQTDKTVHVHANTLQT